MNIPLHKHFFLCIITLMCVHTPCAPYKVMLAVPGDATHAGRAIEDTFERGLMLQCAHYLQYHINQQMPHVTVLCAQATGNKTGALEQAQIANRSQVDLYISLHCYHDDDPLTLHLYQYITDPTDLWRQPHTTAIHMIQYDQAHKKHALVTKKITHQLYTLLNAQTPRQFFVQLPLCFPFKPLVGVQAPAIGIEMSMQQKDQWRTYAEKLLSALITLITKMSHEPYSS